MRSRPIILAAAALGLAAATFSVGCGSNCADTLTCEKPEPPGGAGGQGGDGGATATTTTTSSGGATSTGTAGGDPSTTTTGVGGAGGDPSTTTTGAGGEGGASTTSGGGGGAPPLLPLGEACVAGSECDSGICADGVCCDGACGGTCEACDLSGSAGTCTPYAQGTDPENECGQATCDGANACTNGLPIWSHVYGSSANDEGWAVVTDAQNNVYVAGGFQGTISIGGQSLTSAGHFDAFVAKLSSAGNLVWAKRFGDSESQKATHMTLSGGSVVVAGSYQGSPSFGATSLSSSTGTGAWVARLDVATGNAIAVADYPVALGSLLVRGLTTSGSSIFVATRTATPTFSIPPVVYNLVVRKLGASSLSEQDTVSWGENVQVEGLARAANNDIVVVGSFSASKSFGGATLTPQGIDGMIVRLNPNLGHTWSTKAGGPGAESLIAVAEQSDATLLAVGTSTATFTFGSDQVTNAGGTDIVVLEVGSGGVAQGGLSLGGAGADLVTAAAVDSEDNLVLAATFTETLTVGGVTHANNGGTDTLLVKLDPVMVPMWSFATGGLGNQRANGVAVDGVDRILMVGAFAEGIQFETTHTSIGADDAFIATFNP